MRGHVRPYLRKGQKQYSKKNRKAIWQLVYDIGAPGKKRQQKSKNFTGTKTEAEKELRRLIDNSTPQVVDRNDLSVGKFLDLWLAETKPIYSRGNLVTDVSPKTHARYKEMVDWNIKPIIGDIALQKLKKQDIKNAWWKLLKDGHHFSGGLAPKTIRNIHGVLSSALKWGKSEQFVDTVETQGVKLPKVTKSPPQVLSKEESGQLIKSLDGHWLQPIVIIALTTGMRLGEIMALHWQHFDADAAELKIQQSVSYTKDTGVFLKPPKSESGQRTIALSRLATDTLNKVRANHLERSMALGSRNNDSPVFDSWQQTG